MSSAGCLETILEYKQQELVETKKRFDIGEMRDYAQEQSRTRGFVSALRDRADKHQLTVIAEIKKASPSRGVLREDFDPLQLARQYTAGGASCLSVLTDRHFFQGGGTILDLVRKFCPLPCLRKDFIFDSYQITESRALGADAVLLIAAALPDDGLLHELYVVAQSYDMDVLLEVHSQTELARVCRIVDAPEVIGINNRNLSTFSVSLNTSLELAQQVPDGVLIVSESGVRTHQDMLRLSKAGIFVALIGEALVCSEDPAEKLSEFLRG